VAEASGKKSAQSNDSETPIRYVNLYEADNKIYTRRVTGFFRNIRRYTGLPLIAAYLLLPWMSLDGQPVILFDIPARQFHIWSITFWPQDFMLLAWLLIISAFALFTVTVLFGRIWCGFTCPQTVWTLMFISVERFFEGDRNKRIKLDQQDWSFDKVWRKSGKHSVWVLISFITGVSFIGYFVPIRDLLSGLVPFRNDVSGMLDMGAHPAAIFWTLFFTGMTYLNAGWLREQVCKYMCPYARFQSVMYDADTLAVHYDEKRGENRGSRKSGADYKAEGLGDCIDCSWCVQVCPVDIDIRDGLQYECINCGLCVDACNTVMDKVDYPRNLISFTSEDAIDTGHTKVFRFRVIGYAMVVVAMISAFSYVVAVRSPLGVDVIRDRGARLFRVRSGEVQNVYTVKINNMDQHPHTYDIRVSGDYPFSIDNYRPMEIEAGEVFTLALRIVVPTADFLQEKSEITVTVTSRDDEKITADETSSFIGPRR